MKLSEEISELQQLHRDGVLTDAEFAQAKAKILAIGSLPGTAPPNAGGDGPHVEQQFQRIHQDAEIDRLDREWLMEREQFMVTGRYGGRHIPSRGTSVVSGLIVSGCGIVWMSAAMLTKAPGLFLLFGCVFIALGVATGINGFSKAEQYNAAHDKYLRRRAELTGRSEPLDC